MLNIGAGDGDGTSPVALAPIPMVELRSSRTPETLRVVEFRTKAVPSVVPTEFEPVTLMAPPLDALKPRRRVPVRRSMPPSKLIVEPALFVRLMPLTVSVMRPLKSIVPAVWLVTSTARLLIPDVEMVPLKVKLPVPESMSTPRVVDPTIVPPETVMELAPRLASRMPKRARFVDTLERLYVPRALLRSTAVPVVVVTEVWLTSMPVPLVPASPGAVVEAIAIPCTLALRARVTVPCTVAVPVAIAGRATVPTGGDTPITASKLAPVDC